MAAPRGGSGTEFRLTLPAEQTDWMMTSAGKLVVLSKTPAATLRAKSASPVSSSTYRMSVPALGSPARPLTDSMLKPPAKSPRVAIIPAELNDEIVPWLHPT